MVVALSTTDRQPKERRPGCVDAIDDGLDAELLLVRAAFLIDQRVAMKTRRDDLIARRIRQEVSRKLLDDELVERQITVNGLDDPVAIRPD